MESFEEILTVGGKTNSLGRAGEVMDVVLKDHSRLDELYACVSADNPWVRMRAIDSFEKICRTHPEWIEPYIDKIFRELTLSTQPSIQWHLAQIFAATKLSAEQKGKALAWLKGSLATTDVDWIVSVNTMKALLKFNHDGLVSDDELLALFKIQEQHASKSVRKKAEMFIGKIQ
jgi:hypothetical protein